jgi:hypothetical protein
MKAAYSSAAFTSSTGVAVAPSASIAVRREDTGALASIWSDEAGASPLANPFTADPSDGSFTFYATGLRRGYQVEASSAGKLARARNQPIGIAAQLDASAYGESLINAASDARAAEVLKSGRKLSMLSTTAPVSNLGTTDEELFSFLLPANTLAIGRVMKLRAWGTLAPKPTPAVISGIFRFNSVFEAGGAENDVPNEPIVWKVETTLISIGAGQQRFTRLTTITSTTAAGVGTNCLTFTLNEGIPILVAFKAEGTSLAPGDVTLEGCDLELLI